MAAKYGAVILIAALGNGRQTGRQADRHSGFSRQRAWVNLGNYRVWSATLGAGIFWKLGTRRTDHPQIDHLQIDHLHI